MTTIVRFLSVYLLLVFCAAVQALPVVNSPSTGSPQGLILIDGSDKVTLEFAVTSGSMANYTFGVFDLNTMTANVDDPDFALQALQADRVTVLHEKGQALEGTYSLTFNQSAQLGIFVLPDANLADFSRGRNLFQPVFSLIGAPGSHLVSEQPGDIKGSTLFTFGALSSGRVRGASGGRGGAEPFSITVSGNLDAGKPIYGSYEGSQYGEPAPAAVPEPATLTLIGMGLASLAGMARASSRRR